MKSILFRFFFTIIPFYFIATCFSYSSVVFAHITDPHIFEDAKRQEETEYSFNNFYQAIEKTNQITTDASADESIQFILIDGDLGIEKLLIKEQLVHNTADRSKAKAIFEKDGQRYQLKKDPRKWNNALKNLDDLIKHSLVKKWLFTPGNNDLYEEDPNTISFFSDFLVELKNMPQIKAAGITIVDFRIDAKKQRGKEQPGTYQAGDLLFVGWNNAFFKNNNSIERFLDAQRELIPIENTPEYHSLEKLNEVLSQSNAKYAYIFFHLPNIDDPYLVTFGIDPEEKEPYNAVINRIQHAEKISPYLAKEIEQYPYSVWTVPLTIRNVWDNIVLNHNFKEPLIKGLFAGHFHSKKKLTYSNFNWLKTRYDQKVLQKYYIAPPISVKNQFRLSPHESAEGFEIVRINDNGDVSRETHWLSPNQERNFSIKEEL